MQTAERFKLHSHAEYGNDKSRFYLSLIALILAIILGLSISEDTLAATDEVAVAQPESNEEITRRRPGEEENIENEPMPEQPNRMTGLEAVAPPDYKAPPKYTAIEDRWRLPVDLGLMNERWFDPYNFNVLKADRPFAGKDWFFNLGILSDTVAEPRRLPPTLASGSTAAGDQFLLVQNLSFAFNLYKGETVYRPPDFEFRFNPVLNTNFTKADAPGVLFEDTNKGTNRWDHDISLQQLSFDMHLRTVSDRYDFDRLRVGIQPFTADFRGFLFLDNPLGVRLYGNRDNNLWQYNLAWLRRAEKSTNSGLNEIVEHGIRDDDVFVANLYRQDFPVRGFTSQGTVIYNRNREGDSAQQHFDHNGFPVRPSNLGGGYARNYDVGYLGYNGDGHFGRLNLSGSTYLALGRETASPFTGRASDIQAWFGAFEASMDFDWIRPRVSVLYASGDGNPYDGTEHGFDAIFENPMFAGGDTSFWSRQSMPYANGIKLNGRNGILNAMRPSKEQGQSNFANPGIQLFGLGADFDVLPELRVSVNANQLFFDDTAVLEATQNGRRIGRNIGLDTSVGLIYRPFQTQNVIFRLSGAVLVPGDGFKDLYGDHLGYSVLSNLILAF
jgi:hypothetical protein